MFKAISVSGTYVHYCSTDPAFDRTEDSGFDHDKWIDTGDEKFLPRRNGVEPVRFVLRHLSEDERNLVIDLQTGRGGATALSKAVQLALQKVEPFLDEAGHEHAVGRELKGGVACVDDATMRLLRTWPGLVEELGGRVARETFGNPT